MVFRAGFFHQKPGEILWQDRFRQVELGVDFRKITCYRCDFAAFYKYRTQQLRRNPVLLAAEDEAIRPDHEAIWKAIPRYAEIPETVRCKRCREVLGLYTSCVF